MNKELESLERLAMPDELHIKECRKLGIGLTEDYEVVERALQRLESIDNANPSEALECLEEIKDIVVLFKTRNTIYMGGEKSETFNHKNTIGDEFKGAFDIIKQALLKVPEPKQYLKWEDLEFDETTHKLKAKMNDSLYHIEWYIDGMGSKVVCIDKYITNDYLILCACLKDYQKQFFNDLHLERVEE